MEKYDLLKKPLDIQDIDFRIQSINKGGYATILAYKDARVDMNRLDEVVGPMLWKREHFDNNTRCKVSIYNTDIKERVSKEDVGTASMTEKEKGLASDSFKRACFNRGIGRELYDYPVIKIKLNKDEWELFKDKPRPTFNLKLKERKRESKFIDGKLTELNCIDNFGKIRFGKGKTEEKKEEQKTPKKEFTKEKFEEVKDKITKNDLEKIKAKYILSKEVEKMIIDL